MFKTYQIVRHNRCFGYIECIQGDYAIIRKLQGTSKCKLSSLQSVPGLEDPISAKDMREGDLIIMVRIYIDRGQVMSMSYERSTKVRKLSDMKYRDVGRFPISMNALPAYLIKYPDGYKEIRAFFKSTLK